MIIEGESVTTKMAEGPDPTRQTPAKCEFGTRSAFDVRKDHVKIYYFYRMYQQLQSHPL